ncbi:hypothetical protein B0H21DRAFT_560240 [Amylocystis lapponica]|nr:hypothetical protein B0H21DRAFT_560240 [Amylocystis lapponica]
MEDPSFEELVREYGLEPSDFDETHIHNTAPTHVRRDYADTIDEFDDPIEQYGPSSSPSPPERISISSSRNGYGYIQRSMPPNSARNAGDYDEITTYEEDMTVERRNQNQYRPPPPPPYVGVAGSSSSRVSGNDPGSHIPQFTPRQPLYAPLAARPPLPFAASRMQPSQLSARSVYSEQQSQRTSEPSPFRQSSYGRPSHEEPLDLRDIARGENPRNAHGIRLRPVSALRG